MKFQIEFEDSKFPLINFFFSFKKNPISSESDTTKRKILSGLWVLHLLSAGFGFWRFLLVLRYVTTSYCNLFIKLQRF